MNVKAGDVIHINARFGIINSINRASLTEKLNNSDCSEGFLGKYGFEEIVDNEENNNPYAKVDPNQEINYRSSVYGYEIICKNKKITTIINETFVTNDDSNKAMIVKTPRKTLNKISLNKTEKYQSEIKFYYPIFVQEHMNVFQNQSIGSYYGPRHNRYPIEILKFTSDESFKKYSSAKLSLSNGAGNMTIENISEFDNIINSALENKKNPNGSDLTIKYKVINSAEGNKAIRYSGLTDEQRIKGASSIQLYVEFFDSKTNKLVGKIKYTEVVASGFFGGTASHINAANAIISYVQMNFI